MLDMMYGALSGPVKLLLISFEIGEPQLYRYTAFCKLLPAVLTGLPSVSLHFMLQVDLNDPTSIPAALVGIHTVVDCATARPEESAQKIDWDGKVALIQCAQVSCLHSDAMCLVTACEFPNNNRAQELHRLCVPSKGCKLYRNACMSGVNIV